MAEVNTPGVSAAELAAAIAQSALALPAFLNGGTAMTVNDLLANFPASASTLYKYARVTDLYGQANSIMVCEASAGTYYWRPQRSDFAAQNASTGGALSLTPLVTAPIIFLTGSLVGGMTITPSTANAWPGATFQVISKGALNLFGINISGLIGGGTVPLLTGNMRTVTYIAGAGWQAG